MAQAGLQEIIISLDTANGLKPSTPWWKTFSLDDVKSIIPFSSDDVFSNGNSMHDLERHLKVEFKIRPGGKRVDPREWLARFTAIQDTPGKTPLTRLGILSSSSP